MSNEKTKAGYCISPAELQRRWSCSRSHVYSLIRQQQLAAIDIAAPGRKRRLVIKLESVEAFEARRSSPQQLGQPA